MIAARPGDFAAHRQHILAHCVWMHSREPAYALSAAARYEVNSEGALVGLRAEFEQAVGIRRTASTTAPRRREGA